MGRSRHQWPVSLAGTRPRPCRQVRRRRLSCLLWRPLPSPRLTRLLLRPLPSRRLARRHQHVHVRVREADVNSTAAAARAGACTWCGLRHVGMCIPLRQGCQARRKSSVCLLIVASLLAVLGCCAREQVFQGAASSGIAAVLNKQLDLGKQFLQDFALFVL